MAINTEGDKMKRGRPRKITEFGVYILKWFSKLGVDKKILMKNFGISRATYYNYLKEK